MIRAAAADQASAVAVEHVLWAKQAGETPLQIFQLIGMRWSSLREPTWDDAVLALSRTWRSLPTNTARRAA